MWIQKEQKTPITAIEKAKGGTGTMIALEIQNEKAMISDRILSYRQVTLRPGVSLGYHRHEGSSETIFVLSGQADYEDNEHHTSVLEPGDSTYCGNGESHSVACHGDEPLVIMALILKED
jgi:quercetin dioxygenase-like cupin family protein